MEFINRMKDDLYKEASDDKNIIYYLNRTMNKFKFIKFLCMHALLFAGVSVYAQNNVIDEVVW